MSLFFLVVLNAVGSLLTGLSVGLDFYNHTVTGFTIFMIVLFLLNITCFAYNTWRLKNEL